MNPSKTRDHGGDLDDAVARFGGARADWIDLSTGINTVPFPVAGLARGIWSTLPDKNAQDRLENAARSFWNIPSGAAVLAAPGASSLIARIPALTPPGTVQIATPTYNEHAAAFATCGWQVSPNFGDALVVVHPNNPDGKLWSATDRPARLTIIDES
ncbi:MAG: threonine-phosphate decarboxylase, partial [Paracoccaceae bacterium]